MDMTDRDVEDEEVIEEHSKLIELYRQNSVSTSVLLRVTKMRHFP
jgi:N-dimethylarginine dimethylaminohydrolase